MISLRLLLLVLLTLGCREWTEGNAQVMPVWAGLAAVGVSLGFGLLFKVSALRVLTAHGSWQDRAPIDKMSETYFAQRCLQARQRIEGAWLLGLPLALMATGWGSSLNSLQTAGLPQAIALLGWFLPSLVLIMLLELTAAQFDELSRSPQPATAQPDCSLEPNKKGVGHFGAKQFDQGITPFRRVSDTFFVGHLGTIAREAPQLGNSDTLARISWPSEWLLRMRLGQMASLVTCLTPLLLIAAVTDVVKFWSVDAQASRLMLAATLVAIGGAVLWLPVWLGKWMGVSHFPAGELHSRIESQLTRLKLRGVAPRLLCSSGRWPGAAMVGWIPGFRQLWLGDALIERLTPRQLDMVVMHELAHVARRHYLWRVLPMLWAGVIVALFGIFWPETEEWKLVGTLASGVVACVVMLMGISLMAHRCELDADLTACELAGRACDWAGEHPGQAAEELAGALWRLLSDCPQAAATTWLHPSLQQRLRNLRGDCCNS